MDGALQLHLLLAVAQGASHRDPLNPRPGLRLCLIVFAHFFACSRLFVALLVEAPAILTW